jgi:glycosyltransferase involved in cell wall biosynthesis
MLDPWFKRTYPRKHLKKWLYWPWADYRVLRDAAAVCFTAEDERRLARESFWLYRARERVVTLGIPAPSGDAAGQRAAFLTAHPALRGREFVLFLGRIHPKKGVDFLLRGYAETLARDPSAPALVLAGPVGDEAHRQQLVAEIARLGLADRVAWVPMLTGDAKWGALHACAAFALISHQENFGVAVVEALACGKPVLLSDQINIWREIVADGAGLAASASAAGATEVLGQWRALGEAGRAAMGAAARECFAQRFEIERAARVIGDALAEASQTR